MQQNNALLSRLLNSMGPTIEKSYATGAKVATLTPAVVMAGSQKQANLAAMVVFNEGSSTIYHGSTPTVSTSNGFPIVPNDYCAFVFNPKIAQDIYLVANNVPFRIMEIYV